MHLSASVPTRGLACNAPPLLLLQVVLSNQEAIRFVESVIESEGIDAGLRRLPTFLLPSSPRAVPGDSRNPRSTAAGSGDGREAPGACAALDGSPPAAWLIVAGGLLIVLCFSADPEGC